MGAVEVRGLVREFRVGRRTLIDRLRRAEDTTRVVRAVDGIDLEIREAEIFGILGPNGAGKTTTMRILSTLLEPTAGEVRVLGHDVRREAAAIRRQLGTVLVGERSLYWKLTARHNLEYFAALHHVSPATTHARIDEMLAAVGLSERADDYVERFSTGMRQRLVLARALLPDPPLILLDEPTIGLDPQSAADLRERVKALRANGRTVLLTTHSMEEADHLCDRVAIIDHGRIVALGSPAELKASAGMGQAVHLQLESGAAAESFTARLRSGPVTVQREHMDGVCTMTLRSTEPAALVSTVFDLAGATGARIQKVAVTPVTLEEVFLTITGRELRD